MPQNDKKRNEPVVGLATRLVDRSNPRVFEQVAVVTQDLTQPFEGWQLQAEFDLDREAGEVTHRSITFTPIDRAPLGSLDAVALRRLSVVEAFQAIEEVLRQFEALGITEAEGWVDALTAGRRPGRRKQSPYVYLLWAQRRVDAEREAPNRPIKWLVEQYGGAPHHYSEQAINKLIYMAREKGFLTDAGKPVDLTPRAKRLIAKGTN